MTPNTPESSSPNSNAAVSTQADGLVNETVNGDGARTSSASQLAPLMDGQLSQPSSPLATASKASLAATPSRLTAIGILAVAIVIMLVGLATNNRWLSLAGSVVALLISLRLLWAPLRPTLLELASEEAATLVASLGGLLALIGLLNTVGFNDWLGAWLSQANWDAVGALGEVFGAVGQILIAILAVYIAWRQYVIEKDLTTQQNIITQQQTIDSYFQGISDLVLDEEGLLEDWPQERAIAEGRTAAILGSVDAGGKAKVIRFLSRARLLTPLKRDQRLGRPILDGTGGYEEDRIAGIRVIDLGIMLAGADLSKADLRWSDLSEANLIRVNLCCGDLVKTNLSRAILVSADLRGADLKGTRFFYGKAEAASPRSKTEPPDYRTGEYTGAVIEDADFTEAIGMSPEQRYYCCAWGGSKTRSTIPGGCSGIPNKLGR